MPNSAPRSASRPPRWSECSCQRPPTGSRRPASLRRARSARGGKPARSTGWAGRLLNDQGESLIAQARREGAGQARAQAVEQEQGGCVNNVARLPDGTVRRQGLFMGSGVIEAGCPPMIGARCKQSGRFWGEPGAEHGLARRGIHSSRRRAEFRQDRLTARATRNASLARAA